MAFLANLLGYVLNYLYNWVQNYGWAIIIFSVLLKLILLPFTIKQQKNIKKVVIFFQSRSYYIIGQSGKIGQNFQRLSL